MCLPAGSWESFCHTTGQFPDGQDWPVTMAKRGGNQAPGLLQFPQPIMNYIDMALETLMDMSSHQLLEGLDLSLTMAAGAGAMYSALSEAPDTSCKYHTIRYLSWQERTVAGRTWNRVYARSGSPGAQTEVSPTCPWACKSAEKRSL